MRSCDEISNTYEDYHSEEEYISCELDNDCMAVWGDCDIGLGGCHYSINTDYYPENQIDGFIGEGLPKGTRLWSKAGWMSQARHDAAWFCCPKSNPMLLVVFTNGTKRSKDELLLPTLAKELIQFHQKNQ